MIDIAVAVGSVKSAIEIAKLLKDSADSFDKAEVKLKLAELIGSLADAKMQIAEIQEALMDSDQEKENLVYEKPYYWKKINEQDREGPFCQLCQDKDNKLIRLQELENNTWKCESCTRCYYSSTNQSRSCIVNISR